MSKNTLYAKRFPLPDEHCVIILSVTRDPAGFNEREGYSIWVVRIEESGRMREVHLGRACNREEAVETAVSLRKAGLGSVLEAVADRQVGVKWLAPYCLAWLKILDDKAPHPEEEGKDE